MLRRTLPLALLLSALLADFGGAHGLAFYAVFLAVPAAAAAGLAAFADLLDSGGDSRRAVCVWLSGLSLALVVLSGALHAPALHGGTPARAGVSALLAALLALAVAAGLRALELLDEPRRRPGEDPLESPELGLARTV